MSHADAPVGKMAMEAGCEDHCLQGEQEEGVTREGRKLWKRYSRVRKENKEAILFCTM